MSSFYQENLREIWGKNNPDLMKVMEDEGTFETHIKELAEKARIQVRELMIQGEEHYTAWLRTKETFVRKAKKAYCKKEGKKTEVLK